MKLLLGKNNDEISRILCIANDNTELMRLGDMLKQSEERFRNIYQKAPISIISVSHEGNF